MMPIVSRKLSSSSITRIVAMNLQISYQILARRLPPAIRPPAIFPYLHRVFTKHLQLGNDSISDSPQDGFGAGVSRDPVYLSAGRWQEQRYCTFAARRRADPQRGRPLRTDPAKAHDRPLYRTRASLFRWRRSAQP